MRYTPVELRHVKIERTMFGGYKRRETQQLIEDIADSFEDVWRERGELTDKLEDVEQRFGELSSEVRTRVADAPAVDLDRWIKRVLSAKTLDDVFAKA